MKQMYALYDTGYFTDFIECFDTLDDARKYVSQHQYSNVSLVKYLSANIDDFSYIEVERY